MRSTPLETVDPAHMGGYQLEARLGVGGMGVVYLARTAGGAHVALKAIHGFYAADPAFRTRFDREVDALRRVNVPGTPRFLAADTTGATPYLVTEYLEGAGLDQRVAEEGPLPLAETLTVLAGVAETLASIHAAGLAHRDVKPSNVLLTPRGPRVLDFGVASAVGATAVTSAGHVVGTPGWMAPEQLRGDKASPASDVFCLGGLAVYMCSGASPYGSDAPHVLTARILTQEPDVSAVPVPLRDLVRWMLEREPSRRPSAADVLEAVNDLRRAGAERPAPTLSRAEIAELPTAGAGATSGVGEQPAVPEAAAPAADQAHPGRMDDRTSTMTPMAAARRPARASRGALLAAATAVVLALLGALAYAAVGRDGSAPRSTRAPAAAPPGAVTASPSPARATRAPAAGSPSVAPSRAPARRPAPSRAPDANARYADVPAQRADLAGTSVLVPTGWAVTGRDGGTAGGVLAYDPRNPAARLQVLPRRCGACPGGGADPRSLVPAGSNRVFVFDGGRRAGYSQPPAAGYQVDGVVVLDGRGAPGGYHVVQVSLPVADHAYASRLLNSIRVGG